MRILSTSGIEQTTSDRHAWRNEEVFIEAAANIQDFATIDHCVQYLNKQMSLGRVGCQDGNTRH